MSTARDTLRDGFLRSAARFPRRPALSVGGRTHSYEALHALARSIAATLERVGAEGATRTVVLGHRDVSAFAGVLGALLTGHAYVPIDPSTPAARARAMLARAGARRIVVEPGAIGLLPALLEGADAGVVALAPTTPRRALAGVAARLPGHRLMGAEDLVPSAAHVDRAVAPDDEAYLLFTSGSTGVPKGVRVSHRNVVAFLEGARARYAPTPDDRFSHLFDLTFDLSVFDLFVAWGAGALVVCPSAAEKSLPARHVRDEGLTVWFSVPSTAALMGQLRMLAPGAFPSLRYALFCGEALPAETAARFSAAAPGALVENLYGPTEATVACTVHRWEGGASRDARGLVPIGGPWPGTRLRVVDEEGAARGGDDASAGEPGELLVGGPQVALGYLDDPARTAASFVVDEDGARWYRTGDRVVRGPDGALSYLGRSDHQIKVKGYRVELGDVEHALRQAAGTDLAIVVGWPRTPSGADGLVGFVASGGAPIDAVRAALAEALPPYLQPSSVRVVDAWPRNANGKIDRSALLAQLDDAPGDAVPPFAEVASSTAPLPTGAA